MISDKTKNNQSMASICAIEVFIKISVHHGLSKRRIVLMIVIDRD